MIVNTLLTVGMSLLYIINNNGHMTYPCGTPFYDPLLYGIDRLSNCMLIYISESRMENRGI